MWWEASRYIDLYKKTEGKIDQLIKNVNEKFSSIEERIDLLTASDKDDIRESIVRNYLYFIERQKWINDFSLNCLKRRFQHYKEEGGNSYIDGLMSEIRQLPKHPI